MKHHRPTARSAVCPQPTAPRASSTGRHVERRSRGGTGHSRAMIEHLVDDYGVVLRRDLVAVGVTDPAISKMRRRGVLVRLRQGVYALAERWHGADPRARHIMLAHGAWRLYGDDVALSHVSAALSDGAPAHDLALGDAHLTSLVGTGERTQASIVHHRGTLLVDDVTRAGGRWMTSPVRTALDTAAVSRHDGAICVLDWYLRFGGVSADELQAHLARRGSWPDHLDLALKVGLADGASESVLETLLRLRMGESSLPQPVLQFEVLHPSGRLVGRSDFGWPDHKALGEADGQEKYHRFRRPGESIEQMVMREKAREDQMREITGWQMIRFVWRDLYRWSDTRRRLERVLLRQAA